MVFFAFVLETYLLMFVSNFFHKPNFLTSHAPSLSCYLSLSGKKELYHFHFSTPILTKARHTCDCEGEKLWIVFQGGTDSLGVFVWYFLCFLSFGNIGLGLTWPYRGGGLCGHLGFSQQPFPRREAGPPPRASLTKALIMSFIVSFLFCHLFAQWVFSQKKLFCKKALN